MADGTGAGEVKRGSVQRSPREQAKRRQLRRVADSKAQQRRGGRSRAGGVPSASMAEVRLCNSSAVMLTPNDAITPLSSEASIVPSPDESKNLKACGELTWDWR